MAKMQGLAGKMSGKMGSVVFRVRAGEQIVTQYNPIVKNPNTQAQSKQRVAFKLMSQVAAAMASAIINRPARQGQSARNRFVQQNFPLVDGDASIAKIQMDSLQLTSSATYLGSISESNGNVTINNIPANIMKVRFVIVSYPDHGDKSKPVVREIIDESVNEGLANINAQPNETVLAYGLIPTSGAARVALDDMGVESSEPFVAQVILDRLLSTGQIAVTETLGINIPVNAKSLI